MMSYNDDNDLKNFLKKNKPAPPEASNNESDLIWKAVSEQPRSASNTRIKPWLSLAASVVLVVSMILFQVKKEDSNLSETEIAVLDDSMNLAFLDNEDEVLARTDEQHFDFATFVE